MSIQKDELNETSFDDMIDKFKEAKQDTFS